MVEVAASRTRLRREEILAAAERAFGSVGWSGGRVERIAADAGVNKQLIFHYFDSKAGLYTAAARSLLSRYEAGGMPASGPVEELRQVIRSVSAAARSIPGVLLHPLQCESDDFPAHAGEIISNWRERQRMRLVDAVTEGQRRGHFRDDLDPDTVAGIALALALGAGALAASVDAADWVVDHCAWR